MTEKELLSALLSKTLNMDTTGVAALYNADGTELNTDALEQLLKLDVERIGKIKPDTKKYFDDGYKKAQGETLTKFEKEFKEKTGFTSEKQGIELVLDYAATQAKSTEGAVTEDAIKKHPLYISTVDRLSKEKTDAIIAEADKLTKFQSELGKKEVFTSASQKAIEIFHGLKPVLSQDASKAKAQEELFIDKLKGFEIEKQGDVFVVLKDGKVLEDNHGHRISFESIVKETTNRYFDLHKAEPRGSAGNGKPDPIGKDGKPLDIPIPKTQEEYNKIIGDSKIDVGIRTAVVSNWEKQNAPAAV